VADGHADLIKCDARLLFGDLAIVDLLFQIVGVARPSPKRRESVVVVLALGVLPPKPMAVPCVLLADSQRVSGELKPVLVREMSTDRADGLRHGGSLWME